MHCGILQSEIMKNLSGGGRLCWVVVVVAVMMFGSGWLATMVDRGGG